MTVSMDGFAWLPIMSVLCLGSITFFIVKKRNDIASSIFGVRSSATNLEDESVPVAIETPVKNL
ncbi:hypothetical protein H257_15726 [Aphanomyces astaci]|uniref:Uncharacterized protein n=1 Tax=Aphanomyces astaci TaxID=112090 RepID=W4FNL5_APHAT|nr:hypothetical protein H257_15726 [Aphanomyces astaci]ETV68278.1 hypothetical protein H257_15726 [Aphanomyces astaci]|eukprot:XP_009842221.1 hypothetical protein H257_15726 [Aphanomyces astaci]